VNPALLGMQGAWLSLRVDHPRAKPELFRRLGLVDGVVSALDFLGDWVTLGIIGSDPDAIERKVALLRGLVGVREIEGPDGWRVPAPKRALSPLDLRIVGALRERPEASLNETARRVGISTRTMTRRYSELVEDWAVWFVPVFDFTALVAPVVSLNLTVRAGTSQDQVARALRRRYPLLLESRTMGSLPGGESELVLVFVTLRSAASVEELYRFAETIEGVEAVELLTIVRMHAFPDWFDRKLAELTTAVPPAGRRQGRTKPA
jgi:DNA-binding Lrp family transcriptional regulator